MPLSLPYSMHAVTSVKDGVHKRRSGGECQSLFCCCHLQVKRLLKKVVGFADGRKEGHAVSNRGVFDVSLSNESDRPAYVKGILPARHERKKNILFLNKAGNVFYMKVYYWRQIQKLNKLKRLDSRCLRQPPDSQLKALINQLCPYFSLSKRVLHMAPNSCCSTLSTRFTVVLNGVLTAF